MSLGLTLLWIGLISAFTLGGAYYARRYGRPDALIALYAVLAIFSNITASKAAIFDFGFVSFTTTFTVLVFSVTFLLTDIVNERFGRKETQRMIIITLFAQLAVIILSYLAIHATPAPFFQNQAAFEALLGAVPRIVAASLIASFISETFDAYVFAWFRKLTEGRHLWMRNAFSSLPAMLIDSTVFVFIAFYGVLPVMPLIIGNIVLKWMVGIVDIPFIYAAKAVLGNHVPEDK